MKLTIVDLTTTPMSRRNFILPIGVGISAGDITIHSDDPNQLKAIMMQIESIEPDAINDYNEKMGILFIHSASTLHDRIAFEMTD